MEKPNSQHVESASTSGHQDDVVPRTTETTIGVEAELEDLPPGYYRSKYFVGSFFATGMSLFSAVATFGLIAPLLGTINQDLGPDPRFLWIALVYNAVVTVLLAPIGRLSDIFGRRYFFIVGGVFGVVGSVVCATAKTIPVLIGGNVLLGISSATQLSWHFVMGELVPMKHRYFAHAFMYAFGYPGGGFGPAIGSTLVAKYPSVGWRGVYWLLLAAQIVTLALWICFYFPPSFQKKHRSDINSKKYWIMHFDYVGSFLFTAGSLVFLLGISWGGSVYPWKSAAVITSIAGGGVTLTAFATWEAYAPLKEPLMPSHLFRSLRWVASLLLVSIAAGVYYAFAIIWPAQVAVLYGNGNTIWIGLVSSLLSIAFVTGQVSGGLVARLIGHTRKQSIAVFLIGGTLLGCMAVSTPDNSKTAMVLLFVGAFFLGWTETLALANATLLIHDQREIGIGGGLATTTRAFISAILQAVYTTIFSNRLTTTISEKVPSALVSAGLPTTSVSQFLAALSAGTTSSLNAVPGVTDAIIAVGVRAYKVANADAYRTVYFSTIAFTAVGLVCAFLTTDMDDFMSDKVAVTLANEDNEFGRRLDVERKPVSEHN